jgi:nucleoside-diphosphate-sugar epimerase
MTMAETHHLLITGAGGFVGAETVRLALSAGHRVTALVRSSKAARLSLASDHLEIVSADLSETDKITDIIQRTRPDVVIHSAWEGVGGPKRDSDIQLDNIRTSIALADAAITMGVSKFIGIGSQAEYGRYDRRINETDLPNPSMIYGAAKLAACHLIRQRCDVAQTGFAWMRLFSVYGPGDNPNWLIPSALTELEAGRAPKLTAGTQKWDYLHIHDVASAILAVATTDGATGVFNLSSGIATPVRDIIEALRDNVAPEIALRFGEIEFGPSQIMHLEGDNSRLIAATGWQPSIALFDGLKAMAGPEKRAA